MSIDRPAQPSEPPGHARQDSPIEPGPELDGPAAEASPGAQSRRTQDGNDAPEPEGPGEYVPV